MNFDNTYVKIDLDAIEANIDAVHSRTGVNVMAVVKADAYGHGAVQVARLLEKKCSFFGVSSVLEAMELRHAGIYKPILILGHTPVAAFSMLVQAEVRPTIYTFEDAQALSQEAQRQNKPTAFHFAVDTGMSRIGFQVTEEDADVCARIAGLPYLIPEGIFSHFATADCADLSRSAAQNALFVQFCQMLEQRGVHLEIRHLDNSAGIMNFRYNFDMVRSGIVTYGMYPSSEVDPEKLHIKPALQWLSRVTHVKTLPAGREISYGGTYVTTRETRVATIPVGYADGYRRSLSGKFYVLIRGKKAPILGRICMDQMMVDVTHIPDVQPNDRVTLVGSDGGETITMESLAEAADTFNYEMVCGISRRVPRVYICGGKTIHSVHYLLDP